MFLESSIEEYKHKQEMKLFGKRKKTSSIRNDDCGDGNHDQEEAKAGASARASSEGACIPSYFSNDYKPPQLSTANTSTANKKGQTNNDIEKLLKLDPETLNSKQRRLIKRHKERTLQKEQGVAAGATGNSNYNINEEEKEKVPKKGQQSKNHENNIEEVTKISSGIEEQITKSSSMPTAINNNKVDSEHSSSDSSSSSDSDSEDKSIDRDENKNDGDKNEDVSKEDNDMKEETTSTTTGTNENQDDNRNNHSSSENVSQIINQLQTLNSKERRKLLRQLESDETKKELVAKVKEESKKVAMQNELLEKEKQDLAILEQKKKKEESKKRKAEVDKKVKEEEEQEESLAADNNNCDSNNDQVHNHTNADQGISRPKKKRKWKDFSHLPPEERERREKQRLMQMEAAARRANGEVDTTRHPLNSERRRANRRKPGRAGKIVLLKKQTKEKQENLRIFNASGYHMRRAIKSGPSETK